MLKALTNLQPWVYVKNTAVVIPCYNEEERLDREAIVGFSRTHPHIRLLLMDDGSTDRTGEILEALSAEAPEVLVAHRLPKNAGKAMAVRAGIQHLLRDQSHELVGYWDADLATPLEEIPRFIAELEANEKLKLIMGCRLKRLGATVERSMHRHYLGRIFATAASMTLRLPVYDTQCGAKLMRRELAAAVFAEPFHTRWYFDVEMLARVIGQHGHAGALEHVYELPLTSWIDRGDSRLGLQDCLRAPLELWKIARRYRDTLGRHGSAIEQLG